MYHGIQNLWRLHMKIVNKALLLCLFVQILFFINLPFEALGSSINDFDFLYSSDNKSDFKFYKLDKMPKKLKSELTHFLETQEEFKPELQINKYTTYIYNCKMFRLKLKGELYLVKVVVPYIPFEKVSYFKIYRFKDRYMVVNQGRSLKDNIPYFNQIAQTNNFNLNLSDVGEFCQYLITMASYYDDDYNPKIIFTSNDIDEAVKTSLSDNWFQIDYKDMKLAMSLKDYSLFAETYKAHSRQKATLFMAAEKRQGKDSIFSCVFVVFSKTYNSFTEYSIVIRKNGKVILFSEKEMDLFKEAYIKSGMQKKYGDYYPFMLL